MPEDGYAMGINWLNPVQRIRRTFPRIIFWLATSPLKMVGPIRQYKIFFFTALLVLMCGAHAQERVAPASIPGVTNVDAEAVLNLVEKTPQLVIVDSRIAMDRKQGYLEGSLSLPDTETTCAALARVIPAKNRPALFYCNGVKCGRSGVAVNIAKHCGYTRLYWYRGGFEDWKQKGYPFLKQ
jgi:rhodanese-related sulfurtransferase